MPFLLAWTAQLLPKKVWAPSCSKGGWVDHFYCILHFLTLTTLGSFRKQEQSFNNTYYIHISAPICPLRTGRKTCILIWCQQPRTYRNAKDSINERTHHKHRRSSWRHLTASMCHRISIHLSICHHMLDLADRLRRWSHDCDDFAITPGLLSREVTTIFRLKSPLFVKTAQMLLFEELQNMYKHSDAVWDFHNKVQQSSTWAASLKQKS